MVVEGSNNVERYPCQTASFLEGSCKSLDCRCCPCMRKVDTESGIEVGRSQGEATSHNTLNKQDMQFAGQSGVCRRCLPVGRMR